MKSNPSEAAPRATTVLTFIAMTVTCVGIVIGMCIRLAQAFEPSVGDMAEFVPGKPVADVPAVDVHVRAAGRTCLLSSDVMAKGGGSLLIVARGTGMAPDYVVHWAGQRTSLGPNDCGASADLTISKQDLLSLAGIAGGFGVNRPGKG
jgi:hypothetical protein